MTPHETDLETLADWIDGRLDPATGAAVAAHVADCTTCQDDLAWLRRIRRALAAPLFIQPPPAVSMAAKARFSIAPARPLVPRSVLYRRLATALGVVAVVALLILSEVPVLGSRGAYLTMGMASSLAGGGTGWASLPAGSMVVEGAEIRASAEPAVLTFSAGSSLTLENDAEIRIIAARSGWLPGRQQVEIQQETGRVRYVATRLAGRFSFYRVRTDAVLVVACGNRFAFQVQTGPVISVRVEEGEVEVTRAEGTVRLGAGQELTITLPPTVVPPSAGRTATWVPSGINQTNTPPAAGKNTPTAPATGGPHRSPNGSATGQSTPGPRPQPSLTPLPSPAITPQADSAGSRPARPHPSPAPSAASQGNGGQQGEHGARLH